VSDPVLLIRRIFGVGVTQVFIVIAHPFVITSLLLITFYWLEILKKRNVRVLTGLRKLRIAFIILSVILFALHLAIVLLLSLVKNAAVSTAIGAVPVALTALGCGIFFVVVGLRIVKDLNTVKEGSNDRGKRELINRVRSSGLLFPLVNTKPESLL